MDAQVGPIDRFDRRSIKQPSPDSLVGFAYPTHGFILPWFMLKFMLFFPSGNNPVFFLNTRAGMKIGRWNTPGLSGLAIILPILLLTLKGYHVRGALPLDLPSNWISIHPGLRPRAVDFIVQKCHLRVDRFSQSILNGRAFFPWYFYAFLWLDLAVSPISMLYLVMGRFFLAKTFFASPACNSCRICAENCPVEAIKMVNDRPYWSIYCESCMRCMNTCPQRAIETSHAMVALMIIITASLPVAYYLQVALAAGGYQIGPTGYYLLDHFLNWLATLAIIYLAYLLMFILLKSCWISRFFVYTSLTHYWARYIAPGIGIKDFIRRK
jgi:ferredoxin